MRARALLLLALAAGAVACGWSRGTAGSPPTASLVSQARQLDLEGKQDEAIALFRQALARDPDSFDAHYGVARALDLTGDYGLARQHFARAIALASDTTRDQALRMMGVSWTFVGDATRAAWYFRQVYDRRLDAGNLTDAADVANELGRVYLELGDLDQGEAWYRTGHDTSGRERGRTPAQVDLADLRWAHAQARLAARRGDEALARRQMAVVQALLDKGGNDDQRVQYPYLAGYVEFFLGHDRAALDQLARADQEDPFILMLVAQAHDRIGETDVAREYFTQVLVSTSHAVNNAFARPVARRALDPVRR
jgi:tetratricopeptide (TPR) repeat protein